MKKNIVVFCDGTGNQFNECNSNVVKLYTAIKVDNEQVAYYHPGVGTMGAPSRRGRLAKAWSKINGLAFGAGFMDNVEDAYRYLMEQYDDGDDIYLFGFSRGAYTIRALAGILHAYGLLCKGNEGHIPYVLCNFLKDVKAARKNNQQSVTLTSLQAAFKETFSHPKLIVTFEGLWDTVSSIGWIYSPLRLLYSAQNPIVQTARHAVSIDERRCLYQDNLSGDPLPFDRNGPLPKPQDVVQMWFAGVHSDVGGSYPQEGSALSNIALRWLLDEAELTELKLDPDRKAMIFGVSPQGFQHTAAKLYRKPCQPGVVHRSLYGPWWLLELLPHRYYDKDNGRERWRVPLGHPRHIPDGALIHLSVMERIDDHSANYAPPNLSQNFLHRDGSRWILARTQRLRRPPGAETASPPSPVAALAQSPLHAATAVGCLAITVAAALGAWRRRG